MLENSEMIAYGNVKLRLLGIAEVIKETFKSRSADTPTTSDLMAGLVNAGVHILLYDQEVNMDNTKAEEDNQKDDPDGPELDWKSPYPSLIQPAPPTPRYLPGSETMGQVFEALGKLLGSSDEGVVLSASTALLNYASSMRD